MLINITKSLFAVKVKIICHKMKTKLVDLKRKSPKRKFTCVLNLTVIGFHKLKFVYFYRVSMSLSG